MEKVLSIIIPTFNNPGYLHPCINSIERTGILWKQAEIVIVNNGSEPCDREFWARDSIRVLTPGKNLGWEGALDLAIRETTTPYLCFQNDDTFIPQTRNFYENLMDPFRDDIVSAVGPITTTAAGVQSTYHTFSPPTPTFVRWLIFFCVMIRREHLDRCGGIDTSLPGGDDIDLSIRLRQHSGALVVTPESFIIHHGFKTGERVHGTPGAAYGWNSPAMTDRTNKALIQKHGFRAYFQTVSNQVEGPVLRPLGMQV